MGSDVSRPTLQGLGMHDLRLTTDSIWTAESSFTQTGPTAGDPQDQGTSAMVLYASGDQEDSTHVEILVTDPGNPGPARARFVHRDSTAGNYMGHVQYLPLIGPWESILWTDGTSGIVRATSTPQSVTLDDDTVSTVVQATYVSAGTTYRVLAYLRDPDSPWSWTPVTVYQQDAVPTDGYWPCQLVLPSGRLLCAHWIEDTDNDLAQVRVHYSDDSGSTWAVYSSFALPDAIDISGTPGSAADGYALGKLRMAMLNGQVCLVAGLTANDTDLTWREQQWQYASEDDGISFEQADTFNRQSFGSKATAWDMVATSTTILVCNANADPDIFRLGSADEPLTAAERVSPAVTPSWVYILGGGGVVQDGDVSICVDEAGTLYVHGRDVGATSEAWCSTIRSTDDGASWVEAGASPRGPGVWWDAEDADTYPRDFTTTVQRARVVLCHNWSANPGNEDSSLGAFYLGGYSDLTMPALYSALTQDQDYASWSTTWLPFDTPDAVGWTAVGIGTAALQSGALNISTVAQTRYYQTTTIGSVAQGLMVKAQLSLVSGGSLSSNDVAFDLHTDDGAEDYHVSIRFASTGFRVYDENAAAIIGTISAPPAGGLQLIAALTDGDFACWYRPTDTNEEQDWKAGPASSTVSDGGGTGTAANQVRWGHISASSAVSDWTEMHLTFAGNTGAQLAGGFTNPDDLTGREFSAIGTYVSSGVVVSAVDGPAIIGDEWHVDTAYRYAIENVLQHSPRITWRSTVDNQVVDIALALDETLLGSDDSMPGNDIIHCTLLGTNIREALFQRYDAGSSTWITLATMRADTGRTGLHWTRRGNTIIPSNSDGVDTPYLLHNDFAGGTARLSSSTELRRIVSHTEGRFGIGPAKRPTLVLEGVTGSEGTGGTAGEIWAPRMSALVKLNGERGAAYRLRITAHRTVDGYYEIGRLLIGHVGVFGKLPDWGRAVELNHGTEQRVARDRTRRARKVAPHQRTLEFTLVDGVDQSKVWTTDDPDYILGSNAPSAEPVASAYDTPYLLEGQDRYTDGPLRSVVYFPRFPKTAPTLTLTSRHEFIVLDIDAPIRLETVLGTENESELLRVAQISGTERV